MGHSSNSVGLTSKLTLLILILCYLQVALRLVIFDLHCQGRSGTQTKNCFLDNQEFDEEISLP